jgi:hypothetical protein
MSLQSDKIPRPHHGNPVRQIWGDVAVTTSPLGICENHCRILRGIWGNHYMCNATQVLLDKSTP